MEENKKYARWLVLVLVLYFRSTCFATSAIPWSDGFEAVPLGSVDGWNGLTATPVLSMLVQNSMSYGGAQSMAVSTGLLNLAISDDTATNVWTDMYVKMGVLTSLSSPDLSASTACAFYINDGYLTAYDGNAGRWFMLTNSYTNGVWTTNIVSRITTTNWFRLVMYQDFTTWKWSIWKADHITNRIVSSVALNLGFYTNTVTKYNALSVSNGIPGANPYPGYLDNMVVSTNKPDVIDSNNDGIPDNWSDLYGIINATADPDGDGVNNLNEFISGTDPNSSNDYMRVTFMDLTNSVDIQLSFLMGSNRNYQVLAAESATNSKVMRAVGSTMSTQKSVDWMDSGAVNSCSTLHRFYQVAAEMGGITYTNNEEWAMYVQPRVAGRWQMAGIPVDFESSSENTLTNTFGRQLMRGFMPVSGLDTNGDQLYVLADTNKNFTRHWVTNSEWWALGPNGPEATNTAIGSMTGFWVQRKGTFNTNAVFAGRVRTNLTYTVAVSNGWNLLFWPFKIDRTESNGLGSLDVGWGFLKCGGVGNGDSVLADTTMLVEGNSWRRYYLLNGFNIAVNGRWWDYTRGGYADLTMSAGQGFYYFHKGSGFTWTNSYGP